MYLIRNRFVFSYNFKRHVWLSPENIEYVELYPEHSWIWNTIPRAVTNKVCIWEGINTTNYLYIGMCVYLKFI